MNLVEVLISGCRGEDFTPLVTPFKKMKIGISYQDRILALGFIFNQLLVAAAIAQ
jgi:hypothetical protein